MQGPQDGVLLRIIVAETDRYRGKPLYEQIVMKARELNLAGATVTRGIMGFGATSRVHTAKLLRLSDELPMVIDIVDTDEGIQRILPFLDEAMEGGLVTTEPVRVLRYRPAPNG